MTPAAPTTKSIHSCTLRLCGGALARAGFSFQDHVAVSFCVLMLTDGSTLLSVWCEGHDDITLIWQGAAGDEVEFVQVKNEDPGHHLSVADLCRRDSAVKVENRVGTSILEKSLAGDRNDFDEPRRFRLVTAVRANGELEPLTFPLVSDNRKPTESKMVSLLAEVKPRIDPYKSPKSRGCEFWLANALIDVRHCEKSVQDDNLLRVKQWAEQKGFALIYDQVDRLYKLMVAKVQEAAKADPGIDTGAKKIHRKDFADWLSAECRKFEHPSTTVAGATLRQKMEAAIIRAPEIDTAVDLRRHFRSEQLTPQYVPRDNQMRVEREVAAQLLVLRTKLEAKKLEDDGLKFHSTCTSEMVKLRDRLEAATAADLSFILGCMYNLTDRCTHRFRRETP